MSVYCHGLPYCTILSQLEHVWDEMEHHLRNLQSQPATFAEMRPALDMIWNDIPQASFNILLSFVKTCIDVNGGQ
jgi:hypothetical protein